ncbi:MAG: DUF2892 domain-containing protein [Saprospiraceae bacterium]|jgi:hypothetical protein|nr:DUF2892 domain-containing protein [Saprospiraceae bacterium]MDP4819974.1 DUF2892 domain-containing protein [Saprospiraceae bacterium]MDP4999133.1 DUF2892 domain-containing protein [Saprospiraceae bacterium]
MEKNVGSQDQTIRILAGVAITLLWYLNVISGLLGTLLLIVAAILILTSMINFCPLYRIIGFTSKK